MKSAGARLLFFNPGNKGSGVNLHFLVLGSSWIVCDTDLPFLDFLLHRLLLESATCEELLHIL